MIYAYDIEIFKNFFSVIFSDVNSEFNDFEFVIFENRDDRDKLRKFVSQQNLTFVGFNNLYFDNVILNAICEGISIEDCWKLAQEIIDKERNVSERVKEFRWKNVSYKTIDLMRIYAFDNLGVSLKRVAIKLKWPKIQELPLLYDKLIEPEDTPLLLSYNYNDVGITKALYHKSLKQIKMRQEVSEIYGVDVINASDSRIANLILETLYQKETGLSPKYFKELSTKRKTVLGKDCIGTNIEFRSFNLRQLLKEIQSTELQSQTLKTSVKYADKIFDIGVGGLHSRDEAGMFYSNDNQLIIDADVQSFYPAIILLNRIKPKHLDNKFLDIFEGMTQERLKAKAKGEKTKADALKITINSVFGKLGFSKFWLYDPLAFYSVTISGQLYLLMLIEHLFENGFTILSANTDGVTCKIPIDKKDWYYQLCKEWEEKTGFSLEWTTYKTYARRDVNNYISEKFEYVSEEDRYKTKGVFELEPSLGKGYKAPIIAKSLKEVLIEGCEIDNILKTGDIYDFLISQKSSKKFDILFRQNGTKEYLQQINRWYISTKGGQLVKTDGDREITFCSDGKVTVLNDISDFEEGTIDYSYYKDEVQKIVNQIRPPVRTLSLF